MNSYNILIRSEIIDAKRSRYVIIHIICLSKNYYYGFDLRSIIMSRLLIDPLNSRCLLANFISKFNNIVYNIIQFNCRPFITIHSYLQTGA